MIGERLHKAMNEQIKFELESSYLYLSSAAYFHTLSLEGMAQWMRCQAHEEMIHAMKFFDHIMDRGGKVTLFDLKQEKTQWPSVVSVWEDTLAHEEFISQKINELIKVAREENDYASEPLLSWFLDEQIEEESTASKILDEVRMVEKDQSGILFLDRELGSRAFPTGSPLNLADYSGKN